MLKPQFKSSILFLFVALAIAIFWPGLKGGFYFDDRQNLFENQNVQLAFGDPDFFEKSLNSGVAGVTGRPVAMMSFAIQHAVEGDLNPFGLKLVNLLIHIANSFLVFLLFTKILGTRDSDSFYGMRNQQIASVLAALWLLAPINIGSVVYIVQRMNLLASFFALAAMLTYVQGRWFSRNNQASFGLITLATGLLVLGVFSKENAILSVPFIVLLEFAIALQRVRDFPSSAGNTHVSRLHIGLLALIIGMILILTWIFVADPLKLEQGYMIRGYEMTTRLLSQPTIIFGYIFDIIAPLPGSIRFNLDFFENTEGYPSSLVLYLSVATFLLILAVAIYLFCFTRHVLLVCLSVGWFVVFHAIESTIIPLEFAFNHRNYLPSLGLLLLLILLAGNLIQRFSATKFLVVVYLLGYGLTAYSESRAWGNSYLLYSREAEQTPVSIRANIGVAGLLLNLQKEDVSIDVCPEVNAAYRRIQNAPVEQDSLHHTLLRNQGVCGNNNYQSYLDQLSESFAAEPFSRRRADIFQQINRGCIEGLGNNCSYLQVLINALKSNADFQNKKSHPFFDEVVLIESAVKRRAHDFSAAYELVQSVLSRNPEHYLAHYTMFLILFETSGCDALTKAMDSLYLEEQGFQLRLHRELTEQFGHCAQLQ